MHGFPRPAGFDKGHDLPFVIRCATPTNDRIFTGAFDLGITPAEFLDYHNPMFIDGQARLTDYTTELIEFDHTCFQILIINNSIASIGDRRLQGVLHTAEIIAPDPDQLRVVNSTMIVCGIGANSTVSENEVTDFISTDVIRRAAYN